LKNTTANFGNVQNVELNIFPKETPKTAVSERLKHILSVVIKSFES
jgi:hypothetical protein